MKKEIEKKRYLTGIDGLRALAVIGVILYHINPNQFIGGYLGVLIFFVLSGYFITSHLIKNFENNTFSFRNFYSKRVKRIYPQLVSVLALTSTYILLFQRNLLAQLYQIVVTNLVGVYNFWQIFNGQSYFERFAQNESPFIHLWTLSIEWQYYVIWPLILFACYRFSKKKRYPILTALILTVISIILMAVLYRPGIDTSRIYYGTDTRLFALMMGSLLGMIWPREKLTQHVQKMTSTVLNSVGTVSLLVILGMSLLPSMNPQQGFAYLGGMAIFSVFTTLLVAVIVHPAALFNRLLTNPIFSYLGTRSYGIYLYQFPVMIFFENRFRNIADHPILYPVIEVILILMVSELSYQLIEKQAHKLTLKGLISQLKSFKSLGIRLQTKWGISAVILALFAGAVITSPFVKASDAKDSQLAKTIASNGEKNQAENKELIAQAQNRQKQAAEEAAKKASPFQAVIDQAKQNEKSGPVNAAYESYGLTQPQLQLMQFLPISGVGDSVMAGSSNILKTLFPQMIVDATISRQMIQSFDVIAQYQQEKALNNIVLIGLGTNGPFSSDNLNQLISQIGQDHTIFWINTYVPSRQWQNSVNQVVQQAATEHQNFKVIDWYGYSKGHDDWFYEDQIHPNPEGAKYYATYIAKTILESINLKGE
ncbi:acyltransferase family protein [Holzapfeliella sp. He02]|uniref:Acyltransferase family protein n=1 Tax=Holzapfeliella saturejae TaxID=3082953 RepID=A0ABU8SG59_9LACO